MKLLTFEYQGREQIGVLNPDGDRVCPISVGSFPFETMNELIERADEGMLERLRGFSRTCQTGIPLDQITFRSPIPYPRQDVIGIGLNYFNKIESGNEKPVSKEKPVYFGKRVDRSKGHMESIPCHKDFIGALSCETELGVIIGKSAYRVKRDKVREHIFGYTIIDDITAVELKVHKQNYFMKALDGACPMGPWIVTADEFPDFPPSLRLQTWINDRPYQDDDTGTMIFPIDELVETFTQGVTLKPASIISTGSPGKSLDGVISPALQPGDHIRHEIEGIGTLEIIVE